MQNRMGLAGMLWVGILLLAGCGSDTEAPILAEGVGTEGTELDEGGESTVSEGEERGESRVIEGSEGGESPENPVEERVQIGEEMEEPTPVDSDSVRATLEKNLTRHLDGLNDSVAFLEDAQPLQNLVELLVEEEKEEDSDEETGPALDLDLTDLRDGILELLLEDWMQEDFAAVADDGLSVIYTLDPKVLCIDDEEEDMSEWSAEAIAEKEKEKEEEFEKCVARMEAHPLRLVATSDGTDRVSVSVQVDSDSREVFRVQVFPEMMAFFVTFENFPSFMGVLVNEEDFEFPEFSGELALEIREMGAMEYRVLAQAPEGIVATPNSGQETFGFSLPGIDAFEVLLKGSGELTFNGGIPALDAELPWQWLVELFHDGEGEDVEVCQTPEEMAEGQEEPSCWMEWQDGPETPEVEGRITLEVGALEGMMTYGSEEDAIRLTGLSLGGVPLNMALDGQSLLDVDLNPANDGRLDGVLSGEESSLQVQFGPELDLQLSVGEWSKVLDPLPDFIPFQTNENIAIQMAGTDAPSFQILWDEEDAIDMQVITGTLTLSSSMMEDAVVVSEGQCMGSIDTDGWSEEDKDALHPLFGELTGETCSL